MSPAGLRGFACAVKGEKVKTIGAVMALMLCCAFTLPAAESDVILQARSDAVEDSRDYHAFWWGMGGVATTVVPIVLAGFFANGIPVDARRAIAISAPVAGGAGLAMIGFSTGKARVPEARMAEIQDATGDPDLVALYGSEYEETLTKIQRRKRGSFALLGSGVSIGAGVLGFLVVYLIK
jgi:hypothetical protein